MTTQHMTSSKHAKGYKGIAMEGVIARWYTTITKPDADVKGLAGRVAGLVPAGSTVLELAPGPGYLSIELARLRRYTLTGLDISKTFVEIARAQAQTAGVEIDFRQGDVAHMPFDSDSFDFLICRAAFKNFTDPVQALREMHRVLKAGGKALIIDLRRDASQADIDRFVRGMGLNTVNAFMTKWTFKHMLLKRAYTRAEIEAFAAQTEFGECRVSETATGMEIGLDK